MLDMFSIENYNIVKENNHASFFQHRTDHGFYERE